MQSTSLIVFLFSFAICHGFPSLNLEDLDIDTIKGNDANIETYRRILGQMENEKADKEMSSLHRRVLKNSLAGLQQEMNRLQRHLQEALMTNAREQTIQNIQNQIQRNEQAQNAKKAGDSSKKFKFR